MKQVIQIRCKNNKKSQKVEIGSTLFDIFSAFDLKMTHGPVVAARFRCPHKMCPSSWLSMIICSCWDRFSCRNTIRRFASW